MLESSYFQVERHWLGQIAGQLNYLDYNAVMSYTSNLWSRNYELVLERI